jgi:hypothetical protein
MFNKQQDMDSTSFQVLIILKKKNFHLCKNLLFFEHIRNHPLLAYLDRKLQNHII